MPSHIYTCLQIYMPDTNLYAYTHKCIKMCMFCNLRLQTATLSTRSSKSKLLLRLEIRQLRKLTSSVYCLTPLIDAGYDKLGVNGNVMFGT